MAMPIAKNPNATRISSMTGIIPSSNLVVKSVGTCVRTQVGCMLRDSRVQNRHEIRHGWASG